MEEEILEQKSNKSTTNLKKKVMPKKKKESFVLYHEDYDATIEFTLEQKGALWNAVFEYAINGTVPQELDSECIVAFKYIKGKLDRDNVKYEEKCKQNAANARVKKAETHATSFPDATKFGE